MTTTNSTFFKSNSAIPDINNQRRKALESVQKTGGLDGIVMRDFPPEAFKNSAEYQSLVISYEISMPNRIPNIVFDGFDYAVLRKLMATLGTSLRDLVRYAMRKQDEKVDYSFISRKGTIESEAITGDFTERPVYDMFTKDAKFLAAPKSERDVCYVTVKVISKVDKIEVFAAGYSINAPNQQCAAAMFDTQVGTMRIAADIATEFTRCTGKLYSVTGLNEALKKCFEPLYKNR